MPYIFGQLLNAQLENSVGAPSSGGTPLGRVYIDISSTSLAVAKVFNGTSYVNIGSSLMTLNTTATAGYNSVGNSETIYNTNSSTLSTLALTLPTTTSVGQVCRYITNGIVTTLTVTGTVVIGAAVTSLAALQSISFQAINTTGSFVRLS